jgi:hypothetical protein
MLGHRGGLAFGSPIQANMLDEMLPGGFATVAAMHEIIKD